MNGRRRSRNIHNEPGPLKSTPTKGTVENHGNSLGFLSAPAGLLGTRTGRCELRHYNLTINGKSLKTLRKTSFWCISAATSLASPHIVCPRHNSFPGTVSLYVLAQFYIFMQESGISLMVAVYPEIYQKPKHCDSQNPETWRNCAGGVSEKKPHAISLSPLSQT